MKHKVKNIHFVGIGGIGMSGIAEVLINLGFNVSGSDLASNATTKRLAGFGAKLYKNHAQENLGDADVVVVSTAVSEENPEVVAARENDIPVVPRALMLAELMRFKQGIAVAGTHGKTTTTSLIASILAEANMDPTYVIGGKLESVSTNAKLGAGKHIVVEADESDASFLHLSPILAVVTNIDRDHMETYEHSFDKLKSAFVEFLQQLPFWGMAVVCIDDHNVREILPRITKPVTTYGFSDDAKVRATKVRADNGKMHFKVIRVAGEAAELDITLNLPGQHYVLNALAAIAIATELNAPDTAIVKALAGFKGVGRRFENYGEVPTGKGGTFTLIDDYGHHPTELRAVIAAARDAFPNRRLVLAFQPHRYTRTRDCFEDYVRVISSVDVALLTEVYSAGEEPIVAANTNSLIRSIRAFGKVDPIFVESKDALPAAIIDAVQADDVVVVMGAGSIGLAAHDTKAMMV
jgi:UDP-N-acetylmuramate--alanine ligase